MKFYSAWYCPFAQRAWMTLLHKQLDFEYIEVDPYQESQWWKKTSRNTCKVPVIEYPNQNGVGITTIVDSTRVVEFLNELFPDKNPLFPKEPEARAEQRYWMDYINHQIVPYFYRFLTAKDEDDYREESKNKLLNNLSVIISQMSDDGPYFSGTNINAQDILLAPFAYRINLLLKHYRNFQLPVEGQVWARYENWFQKIITEAVFQNTSTNFKNYDQRLIEFYEPYSHGGGQNDVTKLT